MKLSVPQARLLRQAARANGVWVRGNTARTARVLGDAGLVRVDGWGSSMARSPSKRIVATDAGLAALDEGLGRGVDG